MSKLQLVDEKTGYPIFDGATCTTFRGEVVTLESIELPRHDGSTGRVYCIDSKGRRNGWYPSVIGARFVGYAPSNERTAKAFNDSGVFAPVFTCIGKDSN